MSEMIPTDPVEQRYEAEGSPTVLIKPSHGWRSLNLKELVEYRELLYFFTWRDIKVRYKQRCLELHGQSFSLF